MPKLTDEPLTKVTMNMYTKDLDELKKRFGWGFSERVRLILRDWLKRTREPTDVE